MPLPEPVPGLVLRYAYLWSTDARRGLAEGKVRPCVVLLAAVRQADGRIRARVAPITHVPKTEEDGIEIPEKVKRHLRLDDDASWISLIETNEFVWPGPDIRPLNDRPGVWSYGILPADFFEAIKSRIRRMIATRNAARTE